MTTSQISLSSNARFGELQRALTDEVLHYFHWPKNGWRRRLVEPLFWLPLSRFIRLVTRFDNSVARTGFSESCRLVLPHLVKDYQVYGAEKIPNEGPLIIAANHPGTFDALVVAASLQRDDFKTIARGMPFLRLLPASREYMIFSTRDVAVKMTAVRQAVRHLQSGGVLLLFPNGDMDPDPACMPGALEGLANWSRSIELLMRKVPETQVQVAILSRLLVPRFLNHPLARLQKDAHQQQITAEMIQVIQQMMIGSRYDLVPQVSFGEPMAFSGRLAAWEGSIRYEILSQAHSLMVNHLS